MRLAAHLPGLLHSIERSTQEEGVKRAWAAFTVAKVEAAVARSDSAAQARAARARWHATIRSAVDLAAGALPLSLTPEQRLNIVYGRLVRRPAEYGLPPAPRPPITVVESHLAQKFLVPEAAKG
jgi:hypothetical protein